jgi:hypothetical protein
MSISAAFVWAVPDCGASPARDRAACWLAEMRRRRSVAVDAAVLDAIVGIAADAVCLVGADSGRGRSSLDDRYLRI